MTSLAGRCDARAMSQALAEFPPLAVARPAPRAALSVDNPFGSALSARHEVRRGFGVGRRDFLSFPRGLRLAHSRFKPAIDSTGRCEGQSLFKMHFSLAGRNTLRYDGRPDELVRESSLSISLQPMGVAKLDCHPRDVWEHSLTLSCDARFLMETMGDEVERLPRAIERYARGLEPQLYFATAPLPARARRLIEELLAPPCAIRVAHVHAQARALDLMCLGLDLLAGDGLGGVAEGTRATLSARDTQALQALRARLEQDFLTPRSIDWSARSAGMNRTKLTAGFRVLFGESIGEFLNRLRMQHARQLLESGLSVSAVAAELSYSHLSSFSTAFTAHFGRSPRVLRATRFADAENRTGAAHSEPDSKPKVSGDTELPVTKVSRPRS